MKYAVVDIGSNSVRLMLSEGGRAIKKYVTTTGLGRGLNTSGVMSDSAIELTIRTMLDYRQIANEWGAEQMFYFATEAVRRATNRQQLLAGAAAHGMDIDLVPSSLEAQLGFMGAYTEGVCAVVDIGGASTEIAVGDQNGLIYSKSLPIGLAIINDKCGENPIHIHNFVKETIQNYGNVPLFDHLLGIGGTAATFVTMDTQMAVYDPTIVDGYELSMATVKKWCDSIHLMDMSERENIVGLDAKRRDLIVGGGILLEEIVKMLGRDSIVVSDGDNLEGYLAYKLGEE